MQFMKTDGEVPQKIHLYAHFCGYCVLYHCVKSVGIRCFSGPYLPVFGLNTERQFASFRIQSKCDKIRIKKTPNTDTFHAVYVSICASVYYSIPAYTVTTLKIIQRKAANTAWYVGLHQSAQQLGIFFDNILGRLDMVFKNRVGGGDCNIHTLPLLHFGTPLNNYSTTT